MAINNEMAATAFVGKGLILNGSKQESKKKLFTTRYGGSVPPPLKVLSPSSGQCLYSHCSASIRTTSLEMSARVFPSDIKQYLSLPNVSEKIQKFLNRKNRTLHHLCLQLWTVAEKYSLLINAVCWVLGERALWLRAINKLVSAQQISFSGF